VKAVILCGGRAERMRPLREDKWALEFLGRPLVYHVAALLLSSGVRELLFVGNRDNIEILRRATSGLGDKGCDYAVQPEHTGMAGAIEAVAERLSGPFLLVSSNDVVDAEAYRMVLGAAAEGCDIALLAARPGRRFPGGYLVVDERMAVHRIVEKPEPGQEPSDLVNVVVHYHREPSRLLDALGRVKTDRDDRYEAALDLLMAGGAGARAVPYGGFWGAIKYPPDVFRVMEYYLGRLENHVAPGANVSSRAVLDGPVYVAENATVLENAVVRGPAYLGEGCVIGNNALLRGGVEIGAASVVGFSTEIKHSYIGRGCWFHTNYVGDSIIEEGCSFGSGAVTANLRLDETNVRMSVEGRRIDTGTNKLGVIMGTGCRVGINAGLMPGVLIGPGAVVGPHVCLTQDLAKGQRVMPSDAYGRK